jgi:hypothetical protein
MLELHDESKGNDWFWACSSENQWAGSLGGHPCGGMPPVASDELGPDLKKNVALLGPGTNEGSLAPLQFLFIP